MVLKCTATCLLALALFSSFCDAQWPGQKPGRPQKPVPPPSKPLPSDPQQTRQTFEKPLTWTYPEDPKPQPQPEVPFEVRHPVPVATVAVDCRESYVHVEVKKDMFGTGQLINPGGLTLGDCVVTAEDTNGQVLIFEYELQSCGSVLRMTDGSFIYSYILNYNPPVYGDSPVVRTSKAAVIVECHYPRKQNVSSLALDPLWIPFSAVKVAEEFLYFSLKLMTDDWMYERPSYQYFLGDTINIEAAVMQYFHVPLRVYVDYCVATVTPDANSNPRYAFIDNHGCLIDARVTRSASKFMPRSAENKLQFQLEAFRFQGADSGLMYITCQLKATSTNHAIHEQHRACSYVSNMWKEASGSDSSCASCDTGLNIPVPGSGSGPTTGSDPRYVPGTGTGTLYGGGSLPSYGTGSGTVYGSGSPTGYGTGSGGVTWSTGVRPPQSPAARKVRHVSTDEVFDWEGEVTVGPFAILEKVINA